MFDDFKQLIHWAEWGVWCQRAADRHRLVHESKEATMKRMLALAAAIICRECDGYRHRGDRMCEACAGTGNTLKREVSD